VQEFVESLETPRRILLMVKAGAGTDSAIDSLKPTWTRVTSSSMVVIPSSRIRFVVIVSFLLKVLTSLTGVSGGEEGALKGPSIMPGGQKEAYELVAPI
jgi:6-phosphogluconate dehydrogenase